MDAVAGPIAVYFTSFAGIEFVHNVRAPVSSEFKRLRRRAKWDEATTAEERRRFRDAVADEFGVLFGTDLDDLDALQRLCALVKIRPPPDNARECRKVLKKNVFVNIYNLIDAERLRHEPILFDTEVSLANYTKKGRKYPLEQAKGKLMQFMLRMIVRPRPGAVAVAS